MNKATHDTDASAPRRSNPWRTRRVRWPPKPGAYRTTLVMFLQAFYKEDSKINPPSRQTTPRVGYSPMETTPKSQSASDSKIIMEGITFDDVLLIPQASNVMPATADTSTRLTKDITLNIPMVSAPMDTVTESELAIALAQEGGIGIIHKNLSIEAQAREVIKVKRSANGVITDPITLGPDDTVGRAIDLMHEYKVSGFPITEDGSIDLRSKGKLVGILTRRDLKFAQDANTPIRDVMTSENLVTAPDDTTLAQAEGILNQLKVENSCSLIPMTAWRD